MEIVEYRPLHLRSVKEEKVGKVYHKLGGEKKREKGLLLSTYK